MAYVYMLRCADGSLYTGIARDIGRRMREHFYRMKSGAKYTKSHSPAALEMVWETKEWSDAARLEYHIKRLEKARKEQLIRQPEDVETLFGEKLKGAHYKVREDLRLADLLTEPKEAGVEGDRLQRQLDFIMELDKEKEIVRQTYLADGSRKETDAEHAWHLAIMCCILSEYANEPIDVAKTVMMLLTHDLVEIDAGDTYAYDVAGNATKRERELRAADRLYGLLPAEQAAYMRSLWDEFEAMETPEAKFANTLDKVQPVLLTDAADGKSWREHGVQDSWLRKRNARTHEGSERLWELVRELVEKNTENGNIKRDQEPGGALPSGR